MKYSKYKYVPVKYCRIKTLSANQIVLPAKEQMLGKANIEFGLLTLIRTSWYICGT